MTEPAEDTVSVPALRVVPISEPPLPANRSVPPLTVTPVTFGFAALNPKVPSPIFPSVNEPLPPKLEAKLRLLPLVSNVAEVPPKTTRLETSCVLPARN